MTKKTKIKRNLRSWIDKKYYPNGKQWYRTAHQYCQDLTGAYNIPVSKIAGVMIAKCVQELAKERSLRPFELQAIVWLNVVENNIPI